MQVANSIFDHPWQRLPAAAVDRQVSDRSAWVVITEIQRIEIGVCGLQAPPHLGVAFADEFRRNQAMRDPGLIRYHDEQIPGALEQPQRIGSPRKQLEILETMQVDDVDIQRSVTIEKNVFTFNSAPSPKPQVPSSYNAP